MSDLTERIEALEKENERLKKLNDGTRMKVEGLRAVIKVLKEEFPRHGEIELAQLLHQVVRVEL